jgi:hypothetical protein
MIRLEHLQSQSKLPDIVRALNPQRSSFGLRNCRQQKRGENSNDGNDHQKFNQSERRIFFIRVQSVFHPWLIIVGSIEIGTVRFNQKVCPPQSARGLAHSKTLRELENHRAARSVLDCGGPPPLFPPATFQIMPMLD